VHRCPDFSRPRALAPAKQKAQDLGLRIANHHHVVERLEEDESLMKILKKRGAKVSAGLIRKARVADDLGWMCPYTGHLWQKWKSSKPLSRASLHHPYKYPIMA
jgi:hypothetical protein